MRAVEVTGTLQGGEGAVAAFAFKQLLWGEGFAARLGFEEGYVRFRVDSHGRQGLFKGVRRIETEDVGIGVGKSFQTVESLTAVA